jgi:hypothetical protein
MSGEAKYSVRGIGDLLDALEKTYYFIFMVEEKDVTEAWIKAGISNVIDKYINDDWRNYFEEVTIEEFASESKLLNNILLLPPMVGNKAIKRGVVVCKEPFAILSFSDINITGFVIEDHGGYEMHYLLFTGFDINTKEERKLLIKTRTETKGGTLYRVSLE